MKNVALRRSRKLLALLVLDLAILFCVTGAACAEQTEVKTLEEPRISTNLMEDGEGAYAIEIATPLQGSLLNPEDYAGKGVDSIIVQVDQADDEGWYERLILSLEESEHFSIDTYGMELNERYQLRVQAFSSDSAWEYTETVIPFTVICSVPENTVRLTVSATEVLTEDGYYLTAVAPGAQRIEIYAQPNEDYSYVLTRNEMFASCCSMLAASSPTQIAYYAIATYPEGETRESEHVTVTYTAPYGRLEDALRISAPLYVTSGEAFDIRLEDIDPERNMTPDSWYVKLYDMRTGEYNFNESAGSAPSLMVPAEKEDGEAVLQEGVGYELTVDAHKTGWEGMYKMTLLVCGQPSGTCTLTINGSTEDQETEIQEAYTLAFNGLPENVTAVGFTDPGSTSWMSRTNISAATYTEEFQANSLADRATIWGRYTTDPIADPETTDWENQVSWIYTNTVRITVSCDHSSTYPDTNWEGQGSYTLSEEDPVHKHIHSGTARRVVKCAKCGTIIGQSEPGEVSEEEDHYFDNGVCYNCHYECQHGELYKIRYDRIEGNKNQHMVNYPDSNCCPVCYSYIPDITTGIDYQDHVDEDGNGVCDLCGETPEDAAWDWHLAEMDYRTKLLVIEGSGAIPDFGSAAQTPWYRDRDEIKGIILSGGITKIGANTFAGLTGKTRVDFNQATLPEINENAFAGSNIVCRYYTEEGTWPPAEGVTEEYGAESIKWVYMPLNMQTVKDGTVIYAPKDEGAGWYVWHMGQEYSVTREQAAECSYMSREVQLRAKPTEQADKDVYETEWDIVYRVDIDFPKSTTNEEFSISIPRKKQYLSMHIGAEGWTVNVMAENDLGTISTFHGTINITAPSISTLQVEKDYNSQGAKDGDVTVNGDVHLLNYYSAETSYPYSGNLTVNGTVHDGYVYGTARIIIPNVAEQEKENAICTQFHEVNQDEPIVLDSELNVEKAEPYSTYSPETCRLSYTVEKGWNGGYRWHLQMYPMRTNTDHLQFYDLQKMKEGGFTAEDIWWGENTGLTIMNLPEDEEIRIDGGADGTGLGTLTVYGGKAIVNCPVYQLDVTGDSEATSHAEIKAPVTQMFLHMYGGAEKLCTVTAGTGGSVSRGELDRSMYEKLYFENVTNAGPILSEGRLQVLSHKSGQRIATILPSEATVTEAAGDQLEEDEIAMISAADAETELNEDEQEAFDSLPETAGGTVEAAVNVSVAAVNSKTGNHIRDIAELDEKVEISVENVTGEEAIVVRLHENGNGSVAAETMTQPSAAKVFTFESDLFSRYLLVKMGEQIDPGTLDTLALPGNLTRVEDSAFEGGAFQAVIIPDGCTYIGHEAFKDCKNLVYVSRPAEITIEEDAFDGCNIRKQEIRRFNAQ